MTSHGVLYSYHIQTLVEVHILARYHKSLQSEISYNPALYMPSFPLHEQKMTFFLSMQDIFSKKNLEVREV